MAIRPKEAHCDQDIGVFYGDNRDQQDRIPRLIMAGRHGVASPYFAAASSATAGSPSYLLAICTSSGWISRKS